MGPAPRTIVQRQGFHASTAAALKRWCELCAQARKGRNTLSFYTIPEYESWKESLPGGSTRGWDIKYYKVRHATCARWVSDSWLERARLARPVT